MLVFILRKRLKTQEGHLVTWTPTRTYWGFEKVTTVFPSPEPLGAGKVTINGDRRITYLGVHHTSFTSTSYITITSKENCVSGRFTSVIPTLYKSWWTSKEYGGVTQIGVVHRRSRVFHDSREFGDLRRSSTHTTDP